LKRLVRLAAAGAILLVGSAFLTACSTPPQHDIALVGSFTTEGVMGALSGQYAGNPGGGGKGGHFNPNLDSVHNVPAVLASGTYPIPSDGGCPGITYDTSGNKPPNGSSAGINALLSGNGANGCLDVARSSRGRSPSDPSTIDFYAFAIDGVSWAGFTPGGHQPLNLTQNQLQGIYLCTNAGAPTFTDWSQVGGSAGSIVRYLPQTGSGTLSFFETRILGLSSAQQGVLDDASCNTKPIRIEESNGDQVASGFKPFAITPYSFADWHAQENGALPDHRGGSFLGAINGVGATSSNLGEGCGTCFLGRRYVYNVLRQGSPNFDNALNFVGVDANHNGWVCSNQNGVNFTIAAFGFVGLPNASAGPGLPNSTCRKNPTAL